MASDREARFKRAAQDARRQLRQAAEALRQQEAEIEELKARPDATELQAQLEELAGQANEAAYREAFNEAAAKAGVDPSMVADLWAVAKPDVSNEDPDPRTLAKHIKDAVATRPKYLADPSGEEEAGEEAKPGDALGLAPRVDGRIGKDAGGTFDGGTTSKAGKAADPAADRLGRGLGAQRGGRDDHKVPTLEDKVNEDFGATGRTHAFSL